MQKEIERIEFENFADDRQENLSRIHPEELEKLADLQLEVSALLGTKKATVGEIAKYQVGDYLEVERMTGHTVDVYVGEVRIAIGEIVEMDNNFGLKIIKILDESGEFLKNTNQNKGLR